MAKDTKVPSLEDVTRRNPRGFTKVLQKSCVGIAGAGGLGSNIAVALTRSGIGKLIVADFDVVEPSNLNRQQYFTEHIGMAKVEALKDVLNRISPYTSVEIHRQKVTQENACALFSDCQVIAEAFDRADQKKMLIETLQSQRPEIPIVAGSGMAGAESANTIQTQAFGNLYISGDMVSEATDETGLLSSRVAICANHQAHQIIRLLLGFESS